MNLCPKSFSKWSNLVQGYCMWTLNTVQKKTAIKAMTDFLLLWYLIYLVLGNHHTQGGHSFSVNTEK